MGLMKKWNDQANDTFAAVLVILLTFIIVSGVLVALFEVDSASYDQYANADEMLISGELYSLWSPSPVEITWANATNTRPSSWLYDNPKSWDFVSGDNEVTCTVVRNCTSFSWDWDSAWKTYQNYIGLERDWGWWDNKKEAFGIINMIETSNTSGFLFNDMWTVALPFSAGDTYWLIVSSGETAYEFFMNVRYDNRFTINFGEKAFDMASIDPDIWDMLDNILDAIFRLFSFSLLPEVPYISYFISIVVWSGTIYIVYTAIQRAWSGG